ncbi:DUF1648 domain-containing protein [Rariglobus hedericola]|uniref:DUF1648 domain-containing protein n=1 Tax=Rariglobus hedericola TaxID=2597822 RepID=A0A556QRK1_9BACT|nr:DUF1648 domain-containing protein [Rariglobus hedericola]TSJ79253.1 DUF1648 domain-containing protein [Rariglobus hedericola]
MKSSKFPFYIWLGALPFFVANIWLGTRNLPDRIATHFNAAGEADGWMSRDAHLVSFIALGLGMSAFIIGLCFAIRWFPADKLNVPNKAFWQKPANRAVAMGFLFYHAFWLGALSFAFIAAVNYFIVAANQNSASMLATRGLQITSGLFIVGVIAWSFLLVRFFQKTKPGA